MVYGLEQKEQLHPVLPVIYSMLWILSIFLLSISPPPACSVNALLVFLPPSHSPAHAACYFFLSTIPQARPRTLSLLHFSSDHFSRPFNPFMRGSAVSKEAESEEKHVVQDSMPELTITSPYINSSVDSNTFMMGNPISESTLTLCQSRLYPYRKGLRIWPQYISVFSLSISLHLVLPSCLPHIMSLG